jgi:hypothetical protein
VDKFKDNLIYYKYKALFQENLEKYIIGLWMVIIISDLLYYFLNGDDDVDFELSSCHMILASINLIIPTLIKVSEAWTNAVFYRLFDLLQI